ncbi:MAG: site-specific integrase [Desulfobacterales bacterium]
MKGSIYTDEKCPVCDKVFKYDANRAGMFCANGHKPIPHYGKCRVQFQRTKKRFDSVQAAEQFLNYLRWQYQNGGYDPRDYQADNPLAFKTLADKWLAQKAKENIKLTTLGNLRAAIYRAMDCFGTKNIKTISDGDLEDFLYDEHKNRRTGELISDKTRAEIRSTLHQFYSWVCRREKIPMPEIPTIKFDLGWRKIVDLETQQEIIREVWRISGALNPRVWLGISILSHNSNVRPGELVKVAEGDVMLDYGIVMVRYPKEGSLAQGKQARLWDEEIELIKSLPQALPDVSLFRHVKGESGASPGQAFSRKIFNNWWKRACKNLGIDPDVTLYPGTKHSTMTAMSRVLSPEQVRKGGSRHASKAMDRYIIPSDRDGDLYQDTLRDIRSKGKKAEVVKIKKRKKK